MGPVLANIFMVINKIKLLKRYIYDITAFVKTDGIKSFLSSLTLILVGLLGFRFYVGGV